MWKLPAAKAQVAINSSFDNACVGAGFNLGGSAHFNSTGSNLVLTDGGLYEAGVAYCYLDLQDPASFATAFTFQLTDPLADGFTFVIVNGSVGGPIPPPYGEVGGGLGYAGLPESAAVKFDLFNNEHEGPNSTGVYVDGAFPGEPSVNLTGTGIDLHSGNPIDAVITYLRPTLNLKLSDTVTHATWSHDFTVDIPTAVDSSYGYVGFTGATGALGATQQILKWNNSPIYYPTGFTPAAAFGFYGASLEPNLTSPDKLAISLTQGHKYSSGSVFSIPVNVQAFTTDFTFQISNAVGGRYMPPLEGGDADGFAFVIQDQNCTVGSGGAYYCLASPSPLGTVGGGLGYQGIGKSVAIKFDLYDNQGEGSNSTGIYVDGAFPGEPSINLAGTGIDLHSPDVFNAHITYEGTTLKLTLVDTVTHARWSHEFAIDIPEVVDAVPSFPSNVPTAYVGFTGATGARTSTIQILGWTYWGQ